MTPPAFNITNLSQPTPSTPSTPPVPKSSSPPKKILKTFFIIFGLILLLPVIAAALGFFLLYLPGQKLLTKARATQPTIASLQTAVTNKDLPLVQKEIVTLRDQINQIETEFNSLKIASSLPYLKDYYQDGKHLLTIAKNGLETGEIIIKAIEPYRDFLGLKGASIDSAKTTQDRIAFLTQSVESLVPHLDAIEVKINTIESELNQIDISRYPAEFRGQPIRTPFLKAKETIAEVHRFVRDGKPLLAKTGWLLGKDSPRTYFLMFQNDAELRPTGGFWTAYGLIKVDKGKITPLASDDIYALDDKFSSTIPAPRPIKAYHINVPYWNLRDFNLSPDFPTSIGLFLEKYNKVSGSKDKIDAVVAIDTQVLVDLVKVLGRVGVPGWGNFSADPDKRCDGCPQIIYQLEWLAGRPRNFIEKDRKGFLSPLMHSLLANAMGAEKNKIGPLAEGVLQNIYQKHILFYFTDPVIQSSANAANISGQLNPAANIDYVHLNDANMSSAKTNLFLKQKIKHEIISQNGKVEHKITVTYTNPSKASNCNLEKGDLCLNAPKYRNWFRFYVPAGSTLTKMTGSEVEPVIYEESGKQVFEGFYGDKYPLYAESSSKTSVQYVSSIPAGPNYTLYLQKQPGTKPMEYELIANGQKQNFVWKSDKIIKLAL